VQLYSTSTEGIVRDLHRPPRRINQQPSDAFLVVQILYAAAFSHNKKLRLVTSKKSAFCTAEAA
jgi:hypothetical protein